MQNLEDDKGGRLNTRKILTGLGGLGRMSHSGVSGLAGRPGRHGHAEMIKQAEWIAGLDLTEESERARPARSSRSLAFAELRKVDVGYDVPPALTFFPAPRPAAAVRRNQATPIETPSASRPDSAEELAFLPVTELSALIRSRQVSSTELTKLYLARLKRFDPLLKCVVTLTEELALKQAAQADREIAAGTYPRPAARHSLGGQGPDRLSRLPDDLGRDAVQGPGDRREGDRGGPAGGGRRGAGGQAVARGAGAGRPLVRRPDPQPVGPADRLERLVGRLGLGGRRRTGRLRDRQRDARQHRLALPGLRRDRGCGRPSAASAGTAA